MIRHRIKELGGIYGSIALGYYLLQKRRELKKEAPLNNRGKLYKAGEIRALELAHIKKEVQA